MGTDKYLKILQDCKNNSEIHEDWKNRISKAFGKNIATDAHIAVFTPLIDGSAPNVEERFKGVYPIEKTINEVVQLSALKEALDKCPMVDCYDEIVSDCDACFGRGMVDYTFEYDTEIYEIEDECPVCEGERNIVQKSKNPNGQKEKDKKQAIFIGASSFLINIVEKIVFIAETLGVNSICFVSQESPYSPNHITIGDVYVIAMPCTYEENECYAKIPFLTT